MSEVPHKLTREEFMDRMFEHLKRAYFGESGLGSNVVKLAHLSRIFHKTSQKHFGCRPIDILREDPRVYIYMKKDTSQLLAVRSDVEAVTQGKASRVAAMFGESAPAEPPLEQMVLMPPRKPRVKTTDAPQTDASKLQKHT